VVRKKEEEKGKTNKVLFSLRTQLYEKPFWDKNQVVAGLDEAGRGPLALSLIHISEHTRPY
jgi:hypothetical protein